MHKIATYIDEHLLLRNNGCSWSVLLMGKRGSDWNIRSLRNTSENGTSSLPEPVERLVLVLDNFRIKETFAPQVSTFSRKVIPADSNWKPIFLNGSSCVFRGGITADSVLFSPNGHRQAFWVSSADCPTLMLYDRSGWWGAAHCGRESIIDPEHKESVVYNLVRSLGNLGLKPRSLSAYVVLGIQTNFYHEWSNPSYGEKNRRMVTCVVEEFGSECVSGDLSEGNISLNRIIRKQLEACGVSPRNIHMDARDTFADLDKSGAHKWWSARRAQATDEPNGRNGVLIFSHPH